MPRALDSQQKAALVAFLDELYTRAGYKHDVDWGRDAGVHQTSISKVRSNANGNQIDSYNLYRLIRAAARRIDESEVALALQSAQPVGLAEAVARLEAVVARLTEHLTDGQDGSPDVQGHGRPP